MRCLYSRRPDARTCPVPPAGRATSALGATWGRSRLMRLSGQAEVAPHVDLNYYWRERMRVHVPITTTPSVRFQCGDAETHMAEGECWLFDTWRMHRVLNEGSDERIHLVADTVGGQGFWDLVGGGRTPGPAPRSWQPRLVPPDGSARPALDLESFNLPTVMTPWEVREHIVFLLSDALPAGNLAAIQQALLLFSRRWQGLWSRYGDVGDGWPRYRDLLECTRADLLARGIDRSGDTMRRKSSRALRRCRRPWKERPRPQASEHAARTGARRARCAVAQNLGLSVVDS